MPKKITMSLADMITEHARLMKVLKTGKGTKSELAKQKIEIEKYMKLIKAKS